MTALKVTGFLLAAGQSRRFGSDKRRHQLPDGRSLLQAALDVISPFCDDVLIAVRNSDSDLADCLALQSHHILHHVQTDNAGMGDSLSELARTVIARKTAPAHNVVSSGQSTEKNAEQFPESDGTVTPHAILVALADMPYIRAETLRHLLEAFAQANTQRACSTLITMPAYRGQRGHPVLFDASLLHALATCEKDSGARHVVTANQAHVKVIEVDDDGVLRDMDQPPSM